MTPAKSMLEMLLGENKHLVHRWGVAHQVLSQRFHEPCDVCPRISRPQRRHCGDCPGDITERTQTNHEDPLRFGRCFQRVNAARRRQRCPRCERLLPGLTEETQLMG